MIVALLGLFPYLFSYIHTYIHNSGSFFNVYSLNHYIKLNNIIAFFLQTKAKTSTAPPPGSISGGSTATAKGTGGSVTASSGTGSGSTGKQQLRSWDREQ